MITPTLIEEEMKKFDTFIKESESLVKGMTELYGTPTDLPTHYTKSIKSFLSSALVNCYKTAYHIGYEEGLHKMRQKGNREK